MSVFSDFDWSWRGVRVRETGAEIRFSPALAWDVLRGGLYIVLETLRPQAATFATISYVPSKPRAWYLIWGALRQAGLREGTAAPIVLHFEDQTICQKIDLDDRLHLNGRCTDISKSHVAAIFERVFGYSLAINPELATEPYLEKAEENGLHDATIESAPQPAAPGRSYQRLIDNRTKDGTVLDYRCPTVFGKIPLVFLKERPVNQRFANLNSRVRLSTAEACFSAEEISRIAEFCKAMTLDWGGLDVLRDMKDGRIYIVDVNKTDMGPPLALPITDKLAAIKTLGKALRDGLLMRL